MHARLCDPSRPKLLLSCTAETRSESESDQPAGGYSDWCRLGELIDSDCYPSRRARGPGIGALVGTHARAGYLSSAGQGEVKPKTSLPGAETTCKVATPTVGPLCHGDPDHSPSPLGSRQLEWAGSSVAARPYITGGNKALDASDSVTSFQPLRASREIDGVQHRDSLQQTDSRSPVHATQAALRPSRLAAPLSVPAAAAKAGSQRLRWRA